MYSHLSRGPVRFAVNWAAVRLVVGTVVLVLVMGVVFGAAAGLGLSWLMKNAVHALAS
jgi:hypothetical protein